ncbi:MAG: hypothetical protein ACAF41_27935 [Leptolyngbya sp. BL-A-14]
MSIFQFQTVAKTEAEAQQFMEAVEAKDPGIEEWEYNVGTPQELVECYGFGVTHYSPKQLQKLADEMGVVLAYAENKAKADERDDELVQRVLKANQIVAKMNLSSDGEILHQMFLTCQKLLEDPSYGEE